MKPKPAIISTEFWLTLAVIIGGIVLVALGKISGEWVVPTIGVVVAAYTGLRTLHKNSTAQIDTSSPPHPAEIETAQPPSEDRPTGLPPRRELRTTGR